MSAIEKDLAEAIIHYEALKARGGNFVFVDIDKHLTLLHKWLKRETALRNELERSWSDVARIYPDDKPARSMTVNG